MGTAAGVTISFRIVDVGFTPLVGAEHQRGLEVTGIKDGLVGGCAIVAHEALNRDVIDTCGQVLDGLVEVELTVVSLNHTAVQLSDVTTSDGPTGDGAIVLVWLNLIVDGIPTCHVVTLAEVCVDEQQRQVVTFCQSFGVFLYPSKDSGDDAVDVLCHLGV